jgi:PAS domain S-box-containing protein
MGMPAALAAPSHGRMPGAVGASDLAILDWVPDGIVIADRSGRIVFTNRSAESLTGYGRHELIGSQIEVLLPEKVRADHSRHRRSYFAGRTGPRPMSRADLDFHLQRKDGGQISADISLGSVNARDGRYSVTVIRDITPLKRLQSELGR